VPELAEESVEALAVESGAGKAAKLLEL